MKRITNTSMQGFEIILKTPKGIQETYLRPKQSIVVPDTHVSAIVNNLLARRMVRVETVNSDLPSVQEYTIKTSKKKG